MPVNLRRDGRLRAGGSMILGLVAWLAAFGGVGPPLAARAQDGTGTAEIDGFMKEVLERRNANWEDLYRHTVRDREVLEVSGPGGVVMGGYRAEAVWYVREGFMVRSPVRVDGAAVSEEEREEAERRFLARARRRLAERAEAEADGSESPEREHFLGFPYEPGRYLLAGRDELDGRETLVIEYYPRELFEDDEDAPDPEDLRWRDRFAKTSRITLWVLPDERQIVQVEYDNIGLDFLPLRWLVQVEGIGATMRMTRPFPELDVWLPESIRMHGDFVVAAGTMAIDYRLEYFDYREADVEARVRYRLPGERQDPER